MKLVLSRATKEDAAQLVPILFDAFDGTPENGGDLAKIFMGQDVSRNAPRSAAFLSQLEAADMTIKITDLDSETDVKIIGDNGYTGRTRKEKTIAAFCYWQFHPSWTGPPAEEDHGMDYLETEAEQKAAAEHIEAYMTNRYSHTTVPHVLCYIIATRKAYQGKGCGKMMMQWGIDVADKMMLPIYLEASDCGRARLYSKMGFEDRNRLELHNDVYDVEVTTMWRDPKQQ